MTRTILALLGALTILFAASAPLAMAGGAEGSEAAALAAAQPEGETDVSAKVSVPDVDVNAGDDRGGAWFLSPMWIIIGLLAVGVLIAVIVAASRGGGSGTTVIRD